MRFNNSNYNITIVVPSLNYGGMERVAINLANGIAEAGRKVSIVILCEYENAKGRYPQSDISSRVDIVEFKAKRVRFAIKDLCRYFKETSESIVLTVGTDSEFSAFIADTMSGRKKKLVASLHSTFSRENAEWLSKNGIKRTLKLYLRRLIYSRFQALVSVSRGASRDLGQINLIDETKVHVIYNPIFESSLEKLSLVEVQHRFYQESSLIPYFISVGRLNEAKNYPLLLRAFAKVREEVSARLIILGDGELRSELEEEIRRLKLENEVSMPGFDKNPFSYMAKAAAFVMSSDYEGFGNVIVEALACGTTVVSTDCPSGPSEILENGKYGYLVPVGDSNALASAMLEALQKPFPPELLKQRATEFSVEKATKRYIALFDEIMEKE